MRIIDWSTDVCSSDHQDALDHGGGEPLVPERYGLREAGLLDEIAGELAHRLAARPFAAVHVHRQADDQAADAVVAAEHGEAGGIVAELAAPDGLERRGDPQRSEEHTSELQSLMRISYAVFCLKKQKTTNKLTTTHTTT